MAMAATKAVSISTDLRLLDWGSYEDFKQGNLLSDEIGADIYRIEDGIYNNEYRDTYINTYADV